MFSLFSVVLFSESDNFYQNLNITRSTYMDNETETMFADLDILTESKSEITNMGNKAPGGKDSTIPEGTDTTEGALQKSSLGVVTSAGKFLNSVPRTMINKVSAMLDIRPEFSIVATTVLILIVAIILVSSIMRNRL